MKPNNGQVKFPKHAMKLIKECKTFERLPKYLQVLFSYSFCPLKLLVQETIRVPA